MFKEGVRIDLKIVSSSDDTKVPKIVKAIKSFFGHINFVMQFVSNFVEITKPMSKMLKKVVNLI